MKTSQVLNNHYMMCLDCGAKERVNLPLPMNWKGFDDFIETHKNCSKMKKYPFAESLGGIDVEMLTDDEERKLESIISRERISITPLISGVSPDWERGFAKGHDLGILSIYRKYPMLGREVIARNSK